MLTYGLGLAVLVVWGLIIYRVVDASGGDDDGALQNTTIKMSKEPYNDYAVVADTTKLLLNYRDPFGMVKQKDTVTPVKTVHFSKTPRPIAKPIFHWGFIQYLGYMYNPASKKLISLVNINGQSEMMSEGATKDNVKLIKNMRDSIKVSFNNMTKFITRKPSQ